MPATKTYPFYIKAPSVLLGLTLLVYAMSSLRDILVPLAFSLIFAILLNPLVNKIKTKTKWSKGVSIFLTMLIAVIAVSGILYFLSSQIIGFGDNLPLLKSKLSSLLNDLKQWMHMKFGVSLDKQKKMLDDALNSGTALLGQTLNTALGVISVIVLIPVYVFFILFYKTLILSFLFEVFAEENSKQVGEILDETKKAIQSYMVGLLLEALIVAILNSAGLLILGVDYAILLGVIGALLNMIPYIGGIVAIALPVLIATVTKDGFSTQIGIIIAYAIIQFIDNNILVPRIVSSKVQINALLSIVIVLLGGALWGVSGMFLSLPIVAIIKIIFDRIDDLKPWGKLLGDDVPTRHKGQVWLGRRRKPKKESVAEKIVD